MFCVIYIVYCKKTYLRPTSHFIRPEGLTLDYVIRPIGLYFKTYMCRLCLGDLLAVIKNFRLSFGVLRPVGYELKTFSL